MAQLVRHRRDVAGVARVVQQYVGSEPRDDTIAVGSADLTWSGWRIDVPIREDLLGEIRQAG